MEGSHVKSFGKGWVDSCLGETRTKWSTIRSESLLRPASLTRRNENSKTMLYLSGYFVCVITGDVVSFIHSFICGLVPQSHVSIALMLCDPNSILLAFLSYNGKNKGLDEPWNMISRVRVCVRVHRPPVMATAHHHHHPG